MVYSITHCFNNFKQWLATFGAFMLLMQIGILISWASPNVSRLLRQNSSIPLTIHEASWVISTISLGGLLGALPGSLGVEFLGSRTTVLLSFVILGISWICLLLADSFAWLMAHRVLSGLTCGLSYASFSLFVGEVSAPEIRGMLVSIAATGNPFGIVIGTIMETYLPMKVTSAIYLVQCIVSIALLLWLMDSPFYLMRKRDVKRVEKSIVFYYGQCDVKKEFEEVRAFVEANTDEGIIAKFREFRQPTVRKSMLLIFVLFMLPHLSGTMIVTSYMQLIFQTESSMLLDPEEAVIYANITGMLAALLTVRLSDKLGRRFLLITSSLGTTVAMTGLGTFFYLVMYGHDVARFHWLPLCSVLLYLITYSVGFASVPSIMLSEIFPSNMRGIASCVAAMGASFCGFLVTKIYQPLADAIGEPYVFWIHALLAFTATPCALFFMPETKGKTFQEIQNMLVKRL